MTMLHDTAVSSLGKIFSFFFKKINEMTAGKSHDLFARTDVELTEQICQLPDLKLRLFCF